MENRPMKKSREECKQLVRQEAGTIIFSGKEVFEDTLYKTRYKGIDESLKAYQQALQNAYQLINEDQEKRKMLGIDDGMLKDIKKLVYDSYFFEIQNQLNGDDMDKASKEKLHSKMIKEMIQAERLSFKELFAQKDIPKDREALPKLWATIQDFAIERFREEKRGNTSSFGKIFNGGLSGWVSEEFAQPFFLDQLPVKNSH